MAAAIGGLIKLILYLFIGIIALTGKCVMSCNNLIKNNQAAEYFYGNFQSEDLGQISYLLMDRDGNVYLNTENAFLKIKKEITEETSNSKYQIKSIIPSINFNKTSSNINFVNIGLNIEKDTLSLSGYINNDKINADFKKLKINIPAYHCGSYYIGDNKNGTNITIKNNGTVIIKIFKDGKKIENKKYIGKIIKLNENEYILILNIDYTENEPAEKLIITEALKYYNIYPKINIKFENDSLILTRNNLTAVLNDTSLFKQYVDKVSTNLVYLYKIDYSKFSLKLENPTTEIFTKR